MASLSGGRVAFMVASEDIDLVTSRNPGTLPAFGASRGRRPQGAAGSPSRRRRA